MSKHIKASLGCAFMTPHGRPHGLSEVTRYQLLVENRTTTQHQGENLGRSKADKRNPCRSSQPRL